MPSPARALIHAHTSETRWQNHLISLAKLAGFKVTAMKDSRDLWWGCDPGFPDLLLAGHGRLLVIEAKSETGRLTTGQKEWRLELQAAGIEWHVLKPHDEDLAMRVLGLAV